MRRSILVFSAALGSMLGLNTATRADTVYMQGLTLDGVVIQGVSGGQISYQGQGGNVTTKELSRVTAIHVDGEAALNSAEDAMVAGKPADAVDGYTKAVRSSTHPWVQQYAAGRLVEAANKSNRFDAAVTAYVTMLQMDPGSASRIRPTIPESSSTYIDTAIKQVGDAVNSSKVTDEQKIALLQFQIDLYNAKKDTKNADTAAGQLDEVLAKDPNNPNAARAIARRKLQLASSALDAKKYQDALAAVDAAKASIVEPAQQADAMFIIARAKDGLAGSSADATTMKDIALAYMRIVADFKEVPGKPHVADSLLRTAQIEQQLNDADSATRLYQQIAQQFPDDPAAATAKDSLAKLKAAPKS